MIEDELHLRGTSGEESGRQEADRLAEDKAVIDGNFEKMHGDMQELLTKSESWGGNASSVLIDGKEYTCAMANGVVEPDTGRILAFGNDPGEAARLHGEALGLRVAWARISIGPDGPVAESPWGRDDQIVDVHVDEQKLSERARENLQAAVDLYNHSPNS